jgi:hypothetical protein
MLAALVIAALVWLGGALALMLWAVVVGSAMVQFAMYYRPRGTGSAIVLHPIPTTLPTDERQTTSEPTTRTPLRSRAR